MRLSYWEYRVLRHIILGALSGALMLIVYAVLPSAQTAFKWSMASAYSSLTLLVVSLSIGPVNLLRRRPNPVSTDVRRDVGIWAGILALFHTVVGLQVHLGNFWLYFFFPPGPAEAFGLRYDAFGIANYTGLAAAFILMMLLALSNNVALRRLGRSRWKNLQRWNYAGIALVMAHGAIYQLLEKRDLVFVGLFGAMVAVGGALQFAGYRVTRAQQRQISPPEIIVPPGERSRT